MNLGYITDLNMDNFTRGMETEVNKNLKTIDGYTPKNNKCFIYPYNYLELTNNSGGKTIIKYELFDKVNNATAKFSYYPVVSSTPNLFVTPQDYLGIKNNFDCSISYANFPQLPWNYDLFKNWSALNNNSLNVNFAQQAISIGSAIASKNPLSAVSTATSIISNIADMADKNSIPPETKGNVQGNALIYSGGAGVFAQQKCCRAEYINIIDDYFTRFGYAVNCIKKPNFKTRPAFNYLETANIDISGTFPREDKQKLCDLFNNGITIWHNPEQFGDFDVANFAEIR